MSASVVEVAVAINRFLCRAVVKPSYVKLMFGVICWLVLKSVSVYRYHVAIFKRYLYIYISIYIYIYIYLDIYIYMVYKKCSKHY